MSIRCDCIYFSVVSKYFKPKLLTTYTLCSSFFRHFTFLCSSRWHWIQRRGLDWHIYIWSVYYCNVRIFLLLIESFKMSWVKPWHGCLSTSRTMPSAFSSSRYSPFLLFTYVDPWSLWDSQANAALVSGYEMLQKKFCFIACRCSSFVYAKWVVKVDWWMYFPSFPSSNERYIWNTW